MKNKKSIIIICSIIIAIILCLPIPIRIKTTLQCFQLVEPAIDGSVNISIKGWHLKYLFRSNKMKGTLTIEPYDFEETNNAVYEFAAVTFSNPDTDIELSTLVRYSAAKNRYTFASVYFDRNFENVLIYESDSRLSVFVGPADTRYESNEVLNYFKKYIYFDGLDEFGD